ncbi:MAG: AMP-binding protein [Phycisphaerae bacterium]|jgi:acetyl-CoA synthetase
MISVKRLQELGLDQPSAARLAAQAAALSAGDSPAECWRRITASALTPEHPFEVHQYVRDGVFRDWDAGRGPPPLWQPDPDLAATSNLGRAMRHAGFSDYPGFHRWSVADPEAFWRLTLETLGVRFREPPVRMLDRSGGPRAAVWLPGARLNIVESCFQADPAARAIVSGSAAGRLTTVTYGELRALANRVSNGLIRLGLAPGEAVAIVMDLRAESLAAYLGIIQAGGVAVSIAESFAPPEIRRRLEIAGARLAVTTFDCVRGGRVLPMYDKVIQSGAFRAIVLEGQSGAASPPLRPGDLHWREVLGDNEAFDARVCPAGDWINVLFSSGTTGEPKAIPWSHVTPLKCAMDGHYHHDLRPGDVVCWPTSLGWMMGPWLVFATLINRGTIALFEEAPTGRAFGAFVADAGVTLLGVVPSLVRQWRASGCMKGLDWSRIRAFSSTGECSNPDDMHYLMHLAGYRPIIEYCGGTEIGGGYIAGTVIQPHAPSTFTGPALGGDFVILDDDHKPADSGEVFLIPPALGLSNTLLNADHDGCYYAETPAGPNGEPLRRHGDQMQRLPGGGYRALGRADDTMNLGGIKVASAQIERVLAGAPGVREVAAIAVAPPGGGPARLVLYAVVDPAGGRSADEWRGTLQQVLHDDLNPLFKIADLRLVDQLPRTASNKVMRRQLRAEYEASQPR